MTLPAWLPAALLATLLLSSPAARAQSGDATGNGPASLELVVSLVNTGPAVTWHLDVQDEKTDKSVHSESVDVPAGATVERRAVVPATNLFVSLSRDPPPRHVRPVFRHDELSGALRRHRHAH